MRLALGRVIVPIMVWILLDAGWLRAPAQAQSVVTAFMDVRLFDGEQVLPKVTVVLREGRIAAVGSGVEVPRGAVIVQGAGKTLLPGFIDAHVHTFGTSRSDALRFGVTTELDMFSDWHALPEFRRERESLAPTRRADVYSAGTLVTVHDGHGTEFNLVIPTLDDSAQADAFVAARIDEGSDFIKLVMEDGSIVQHAVPSLPAESVRAVIRAAKARNRLAVVHVSTERDAMLALRAGADGLVHVFQDRPASTEFIELARERGAFVVPTLSVIDQFGPGSGPTLVQDSRIRKLLDAGQQRALGLPFRRRPNSEQCRANAEASVRRLYAARVPILAGTDAGNPGTAHGPSLHGELQLLVRAGLSPQAALAAATSVPARRFGLTDRGRIAVGLRADVVLVAGDPLRNITASRAIVGIWKNGSRIDRTIAAPKAPQAPQQNLVSNFDTGKPSTSYGNGWQVTTDATIGGASTAALDVIGRGARSSKGALEMKGEVRAGASYPWAGVLFPVVGGMQPLDYSAKRELVFWAKGDRPGLAMLYSGAAVIPATVPFAATGDWMEFRIPLASFPNAVLEQVRAVGFIAGNPPGKFRLYIDEVEIR